MTSLGDLTGNEYERLKVMSRADDERNGATRWLCRCACGRDVEVRGSNLVSGATGSCGCLRSDVQRARARLRNAAGPRDRGGRLCASRAKP